MQIKWLEDFLALAQARSFSRAAEQRHVTHPAFGRRIKALESWAGTPLIERDTVPLTLTPAGISLLDNAQQMVANLRSAHDELLNAAGRHESTIRLATGRTLARTLLVDLLPRMKPLLDQAELHVRTGSLTECAHRLERDDVDFMLIYHHPLLAVRLSARQFMHHTLAQDKLVPVTRAAPSPSRGQRRAAATSATPYLAYAGTLALGRLVQDCLSNNPHAPRLRRVIECDSADALYEYALKGLGVAWLPWSMVAGACRDGRLVRWESPHLEVKFEVRLYRAKRALGTLAEQTWTLLTD